MIPLAALLPHERYCSDCHGEKHVERCGIHPSRPVGGVSAMEAPDTWTEPCRACDGTGVQVTERRETDRPADSPLVVAFRLARAESESRAITIHEQADTIAVLRELLNVADAEIANQKRMNRDQARLLHTADYQHAKGA